MGNPQSIRTYEKLNENIEKWTGLFYTVMVQVSVPAVLMPNFIISFYLYFATDFGGDAFSLPIPIWCVTLFTCNEFKFKILNYEINFVHFLTISISLTLSRAPFDCKTPIRYLIIFAIESSTVFYVCHICACYLGTFVASCYIIFTFCNDIKNNIYVLDKSSKANANSVELMKRVADIVEFHVAAKQLSHNLIVFHLSLSLVNSHHN